MSEAKPPKRTTFEVKVTNLLPKQNVLVQLQAELRYTQQLSSTNTDYNLKNTYEQQSSLQAQTKSNAESKNDEFYNESKQHRSGNNKSENISSNTTDASVSASYKLATVDANYSQTNDNYSLNESSHNNTDHNIKSGKNASSFSKGNAHTNIKNDIISNKIQKQNTSSFNSILTNKTIEPGFVRIIPSQTLSIPVVVESESQVVYLSVYIEDYSLHCIANQFQINVQHIQIIQRNGYVAIEPMLKESIGFRKKLKKWGIPDSLIDCMEQCGWNSPRLWDDIRNEDLILMGFKKGHINKFNNGYKEWKRINNWLYNDITFKSLFDQWYLPNKLYDNMINEGWVNMEFWDKLDEDDLKNLGFKKGHIIIFKSKIKNKQHLNQWIEIKKEFEKNRENNNDTKYEMDDEDDNFKPIKPQFKIINITHNYAYIELFNIIKSNEYYQVELCEKNENNEQNLWNYIMKIKSGTGKKHKIKLDKMDTNYLIRIKSKNHKYDTNSDYTINSFKTQNKKWMIENISDIKMLNYKINLINPKKINFIIIQFDKNEIINLYHENMNGNKYYIEIKKQESESDDEKKKDLWEEIISINNKQYEYLLNYLFIKNKIYLFRIKSINNFQYIQYSKQIVKFEITSQYYHPFGCRQEWKHVKDIEWFHPKGTDIVLCCTHCNSTNVHFVANENRMNSQPPLTANCGNCNKEWRDNRSDGFSKTLYKCCMGSTNASGCSKRYKCCNRSSVDDRGCKKYVYRNCCNGNENDKGCQHRYVCKQTI